MFGDNFKDVPPYLRDKGTKNKRKVQVEAFSLDDRKKHFCKNKSFLEINNNCNKLSDSECKMNDCCILLNGNILEKGQTLDYNKCVAGNKSGPKFHSEMKCPHPEPRFMKSLTYSCVCW